MSLTIGPKPWAYELVTNAWSGWVRMGSRTPAWAASVVTFPPTTD